MKPRANLGRRGLISVIAGLLALISLVLVAYFSPWLAVKQINVVGTNRVSKSAILGDLKPLMGKPLPQISNQDIADRLANYQLIESVSMVILPPNTLQVQVIERSPIAIVLINGLSYLYDPAGVQLGRANAADKFPYIENAGNPASSSSFKQAIAVILKLPVSLLPIVDVVSASSKDNVLLKLNQSGQKVLWGDDSQPGLKARVLSALMKHYQGKQGITFDVSAPNQPSVY